jgi:beta-galactosidase beta subunit
MYNRGYLDFTDKNIATQSYKDFVPGNPENFELHPESFSAAEAQLIKEKTLRLMDYHKRYRDLSLILTGVWYFAQILDANVDASLSDYDVSDNLQLSFYPSMMTLPGQMTAATINVSLTMSF